MRKMFPLAAVAASLITTAVLANAPGGEGGAGLPNGALPLADVVAQVEAKGYDVVKIGLDKDAYAAVLKTADGRLVMVRVDPQTARLMPAENSDLLRNIIDQPK